MANFDNLSTKLVSEEMDAKWLNGALEAYDEFEEYAQGLGDALNSTSSQLPAVWYKRPIDMRPGELGYLFGALLRDYERRQGGGR